MKTRKSLVGLVLLGILGLEATGCSPRSMYNFCGKIGEETVEFSAGWSFPTHDPNNSVTVKKPNGKIIKYIDDYHDDLIIEKVEITEHGKTTSYSSNNDVEKPVVDSAQSQFNRYLEKIKEKKINQGLESLK